MSHGIKVINYSSQRLHNVHILQCLSDVYESKLPPKNPSQSHTPKTSTNNSISQHRIAPRIRRLIEIRNPTHTSPRQSHLRITSPQPIRSSIARLNSIISQLSARTLIRETLSPQLASAHGKEPTSPMRQTLEPVGFGSHLFSFEMGVESLKR